MKLEEKFEKIDEILAKLDDGEVGIDEAFKLYNDGMKMIVECNDSIDKIEKELIVLDSEQE